MMTFSWMPCSQSIAPDIATCTRTRLVFSFDYSGQGHGDVMASYAASVELRIVSCVPGSPIACSSAAIAVLAASCARSVAWISSCP
mgnify:CR=1 FL=1